MNRFLEQDSRNQQPNRYDNFAPLFNWTNH